MKKILSILLAVSLIFSSLSFFNQTDALETYRTVTKYHLDLGAIHIWSSDNGATWQKDLVYGTTPSEPLTASLTFNDKITKVVDAYVLDEDEFEWADTTGIYTFNEVENYLTSQDSYEKNYKPYMSSSISSVKATKSGDYTVDISYKAKLKGYKADYNLSDMLNRDKFEDIIALLGGEESVKQDLYDKLEAGKDGVGEGVLGYMFFMPIVIEYQTVEKVTIEEDEFYAGLNVPSSVLVGERFDVIDESVFGDESQFACTTLTYCVDDGTTKTVTGWTGAELGESISQSFDEECTVKYTIKAWNIYGKDSDPVSKTIIISSEEEAEIDVEPDLVLPEYTYEGHTEIAKDESVFTVNGESYSATRTYAEGLASNSFKADDSAISISSLTDTKAECTFPEKGTYDITLTVKPDGGGRASDTESIEVRKTPYIIDTLSGFQKQNRKQILTATVANYPGKPLTDYSVTLKDKVTGNSVTLTPDNLQENNATIKTRSLTITQDNEEGFATITVEFLTKTPSYFSTGDASQQFYYEINVEDSKGDTDTASKYFDVTPDIPPTAAISLDSAFLRNEGTNIATIKAEDATVATDGDSVKRTWYYGATTAPSIYTDVSTMDGYSKLSFGTDKIVGFNRTGVGPLTVKLDVKESWAEPTLEEYVTDSDYLTGTALAYTEVQNVAPVVSLDLLNSTAQEILLLANSDSEYQALLNRKTALQQELLANQIDGQIIIKKLIGNTPSGVSGITSELSYTFPCAVWTSGTAEESEYCVMTADSEKSYLATWTISGKNLIAPVTVHAYNPFSGEVWSYTTTNSEQFQFGNDDVSKYLYLIYRDSDKTVVLDKSTGALAGTIDVAMSEKIWLTDELMFWLDEDNTLYAINQNTLEKMKIDTGVSTVGRVNGDLQYITKSSNAIIRNTLDLDTLELAKVSLLKIELGVSSVANYVPICIDSAGTVLLYKTLGSGTDTTYGIKTYNIDNELSHELNGSLSSPGGYSPAFDEYGECNYVLVWSRSGYTYSVQAVNISSETYATNSKITAQTSDGPTAAFESNGTGYFYIPGWCTKISSDYYGTGNIVIFNGSSISTSTGGYGKNVTYDENTISSDRILASLVGNGSTGVMNVKISSFAKSLAQETAELLAKFAGKFTFVGGVGTTADEIIAVAETAKPVTQITASQAGYLSLSNQSLDPGKRYYYDYDIEPLAEGTESSLNGVAASTGTSTSSQIFNSDTLYVSAAYEEDFNDSEINDFFAVSDDGTFYKGGWGVEYDGDDSESATLTFTVPTGKQAIVTLDMMLDFTNRGYDCLSNNQYQTAIEYDNTNVLVDGNTIRDIDTMLNNNADDDEYIDNSTGVVYYKLLDAGTHTITCAASASNWSYALMDNLRVDILSSTAATLNTTYNSTQDDEDDEWLNISGSFETPNRVISYGSQASTTYYGALPSAVTDYNGSYPQVITYYQTVPSGYIQKASVYFSGSVGAGDEVSFEPYNLGEFRFEEKSSFSGTLSIGQWRSIGPLTAGTYSHIANTEDKQYSYARMDTFSVVQYPYNAVTATGNIAFNSSNTKYFLPKTSSTGLTNLSIYLPKGEYLIKNLKIYYIEDGEKIYLQSDDCQELTDLSKWTLSSGLTKSLYTETEEEDEDDDYVKIYKKGEKVIYDIYYSDYEEDPSKTGYWVYSHINWPPDAVHPSAGAILTEPIDRFYLSGKYTVTHWEVDNTQRTGTVGDASGYNKESNQVTMTFYVDGEGEAPWVTYIKTNPASVKESDSYTIRVGVDDEEKDTLELTTEVYLNGKLIKNDTKTGLAADTDGNYPEQTISGLEDAVVGGYQVVCTVSDYSGTGIKSYKYTVVSEGKITGYVNHTDQWNTNRQKYNLAKSGTADSPRAYNVFWSGERFVLRSDVAGSPTSVTAQILGHSYSTTMQSTGSKNSSGETIYAGEIWDEDMIDKWGNDSPVTLIFRFTATYSSGTTKTNDVEVIVDNEDGYFKLHRIF